MALEIFEGAFQAFFIMLCKVFRHCSVLWVAIMILEETCLCYYLADISLNRPVSRLNSTHLQTHQNFLISFHKLLVKLLLDVSCQWKISSTIVLSCLFLLKRGFRGKRHIKL